MDAGTAQNSSLFKNPIKRSRTGCRTCRARHIKCDETPGACNNCTRTKRVCEGYDLHRIPTARGPRNSTSPNFAKMYAALATKVQWKVTSDECRCLAFFQHRSVPHLVTFFDSSLWQQLVLQLCYLEPAVFHAVVALGAANQAREIARALRGPSGQRLVLQDKWSLFALEQSGRSFAILNKRRMSEDPQLQTIILVCCLLFTMCELLQRNVATALSHIQGGLRIVNGMDIQRHISTLELTGPNSFEDCVIETLLGLQGSSLFYGIKQTINFDHHFVFDQSYDSHLQSFHSLQHARKVLKPLEHTLYLFVAQCMHASDAQVAARYSILQRQQQVLLSYFTRFLRLFESFCMKAYGTFSFVALNPNNDSAQYKEQRQAEITRLSVLYGILSTKIALYSKGRYIPAIFAPECEALIEAAEIAMEKFHGQAPTITAHHEIIPALYISIFRYPDYGVRCRGIEAMRSWQSAEGFMNASLNADILEEGLKMDLKNLYYSTASLPSGVTFETSSSGQIIASVVYRVGEEEKQYRVALERNLDLRAELLSIENSREWACIRSMGLLDNI